MMIRKKSKQRGFTIIELMVCIAMASALGAVAVPRFVGQRIKAGQMEVITALGAMDRLQKNAINEYGRALTGEELLTFGGLDPKYLSGTKFYNFVFTHNDDAGRVRVTAQDSKLSLYPGWPDVWTKSWATTPYIVFCAGDPECSPPVPRPETDTDHDEEQPDHVADAASGVG